MAGRFNKTRVPKSEATVVENLAGGKAYQQSSKLELVSLLLTSMLKDQFYRKAPASLDRLFELLGIVDPLFAAKATYFARNVWGLRSITHAAAAGIAAMVKGASWTRRFFFSVVRRPDDMTEILAAYLAKYGKPIPNSLKRGLAAAFGKFDSYQLAKYRGEDKALSLVDVVNLCHPQPNVKNGPALRDLVEGNLRSAGTWESELSAAGQGAGTPEEKLERKSEAWNGLVKENKIGYFALLRNLRNILTDAPHLEQHVCNSLVNKIAIRKSLVFPFRIIAAIESLKKAKKYSPDVAASLSTALDISCGNLPKLPNTLVVVDYSGSMGDGFDSPKGKGTLLGAALARASKADFMIFGESAAYIQYNPADTVTTLYDKFVQHNQGKFSWHTNSFTKVHDSIWVGHGTNFNSIFTKAAKAYDRIFIFSDMQGWMPKWNESVGGAPTKSFAEYRKRTGANPFIYSMDLSGYGDMMFPEDRVMAIPGFSEKVFEFIGHFEQDRMALVKKIEDVSFE